MLKFLSKQFILILKGVAMGAANVVPGVSGGTIAFVTGIYEELLKVFTSINYTNLTLLFQFKFKTLYHNLNLKFIIAVGIGIIISVFTIARLIEHLFENYPVLILAYFFGLIFASIYYIGKFVKEWNALNIFSLLTGFSIAIIIAFTTPSPSVLDIRPISIILYGMIGSSGMLLPGFSGSYILLILGVYTRVIKALNNMFSSLEDFIFMCYFLIGTAIGLIALSYILSWVLKKHKSITIAILTGFVAGSLLTIWPWTKKINGVQKRFIPEISFKNQSPLIIISKYNNAFTYKEWIESQIPNANIIEGFTSHNLDSAMLYVNGIILTGGEDINPIHYFKEEYKNICGTINNKRDSIEIRLFNFAQENKIPLLGICRGMQMINVASGGTLIPDIPTFINDSVIHRDTNETKHLIFIEKKSSRIFPLGLDTILVNSNHHQALDSIPKEITVIARSFDNLPEAIEYNPSIHPYMVGVQFHPEKMDNHQVVKANLIKGFNNVILKEKNKYNLALIIISIFFGIITITGIEKIALIKKK